MTIGDIIKKVFAISNLATLLVCFYTYLSMKNLHRMMYPLHGVDIESYPADRLVKPYWSGDGGGGGMGMKIYLSTESQFSIDFLIDEYKHKQHQSSQQNQEPVEVLPPKQNRKHDTVLLWEEPHISSSSLARSFILTSNTANTNEEKEDNSESFIVATKVLDDAEQKAKDDGAGGVQAVLSSATAGEGIASTSVLLSLYSSISNGVRNVINGGGSSEKEEGEGAATMASSSKIVIPISTKSSIWSHLMNNQTAHIHVLLQRHTTPTTPNSDTFTKSHKALQQSSQTHNLLLGGVDLLKYNLPHHIPKPTRFLYLDAYYALRRYVLHTTSSKNEFPPWDMASHTESKGEYALHKNMMDAKGRGEGYPYWKPEVAIKLVQDLDVYPLDYINSSGMSVVRLGSRERFESGMAYLPGLHVDEIGLTSEKYIPVNGTIDALPLRISFDSHDGGEGDDAADDTTTKGSSSSSGGLGGGGLTPSRWRLLTHLSSSLQAQQDLGFEQSDIDDIRHLISDTDVILLAVTVLASTLHLLFEFLTFKTEVEFWKGNTDLTGLSVRALFMDFVSQVVILLFLFESGTSMLMTIPAAFGCAIALWKGQRGAGFTFVKVVVGVGEEEEGERPAVWNRFFRLFGYELQATRLRAASSARKKRQLQQKEESNNDKSSATNTNTKTNEPIDLAALSEEMDHLATRTLGLYLLLPLVLTYTFHTLLNEQHSGWYSWFITSASSAVYALGFVLMTPQLFLNYKLKSVAHLPWKVLGYRFVNTFIDDLFAFIIRMPTMARISCFRDDVVFFVYLYQRWLYPVDTSRPVEGGGMDAVSAAASGAVVVVSDEKKKKE